MRRAEYLLKVQNSLDHYGVPHELTLRETPGYSYQNSKSYKSSGRFYTDGARTNPLQSKFKKPN